jgi:hypothetical protein
VKKWIVIAIIAAILWWWKGWEVVAVAFALCCIAGIGLHNLR